MKEVLSACLAAALPLLFTRCLKDGGSGFIWANHFRVVLLLRSRCLTLTPLKLTNISWVVLARGGSGGYLGRWCSVHVFCLLDGGRHVDGGGPAL